MYHHAPSEYVCPFCLLVQSKESVQTRLKQTDIVFQAADITPILATRKCPNNQGHGLIIPNEHFENIHDLPLELSAKAHAQSRDVALAMKSEYHCNGNMLRQHNEPAGDQNIWHYHLHVIPRYQNDDFHNAAKSLFEVEERAEDAQILRNWFNRSEK
jgi:histidine triad (HIT) family protein